MSKAIDRFWFDALLSHPRMTNGVFFFNTYSNHLFHPELRVRKLLGPFSKQIPVFGPFFNVRMLFALCCTSPIDPANYKMENKRCPPNTGVQSFLFATQSLNKRVNSWKLTAIE